MNNKKLLAAATLGLMLGACASKGDAPTTTTQEATGECSGVNSCKGTGACGGKGHGCHGKNACKGQGWIKATATECAAKKGTFKAG